MQQDGGKIWETEKMSEVRFSSLPHALIDQANPSTHIL